MAIKFKTRENLNTPGHLHFLTFTTYQGRPYLANDKVCKLLASRINKAAKEHHFAVLAYVFMPDHVHLLICPLVETYSISLIRKAIKQGPSCSAKNRKLIETDLWQDGGGHDRNITRARTRRSVIRYIHRNPVKKGLCVEPQDYRWSSAAWFYLGEWSEVECVFAAELGLD